MNPTAGNLAALFRPAAVKRPSLSGDGIPAPVLTFVSERGWAIVDTPEANIHCTSPDGQVSVGWLPEDPGAWRHGIVWTVQITPAEGEPWTQEFGEQVPSRAVAGFLESLMGHADR